MVIISLLDTKRLDVVLRFIRMPRAWISPNTGARMRGSCRKTERRLKKKDAFFFIALIPMSAGAAFKWGGGHGRSFLWMLLYLKLCTFFCDSSFMVYVGISPTASSFALC